ncbi:MAG TPA: DUF748 domain-containing protein [Bacteroidia bacterium]|jgi:hypothetical protein|nr:DUF748 domain-containing protein [Bacteroidia bacterium]
MKIGRSYKKRKAVLICFGFIAALVGIIILCISPLAKYLIEKYDEKYTGRQIEMDWAYVNPFSGYIHFSNVKIFELKSDSVFLSSSGISANFSMRKLFSKTYEIEELVLDEPKGVIIQKGNKHDLNFNDIIEKFKSKDTGETNAPVHFSILSLIIKDGIFYYKENVIPIDYYIKKVNVVSSGFRWDTDTTAFTFSFLSGIGEGESNGNFTINTNNLNYRLGIIVKKFNLQIIEQYLKDLSNYGSFRASLDADIKATGNFNKARDLEAKGQLIVSDFHFGKDPEEDYASFDKLKIGIIDLSPNNKKYIFDSLLLSKPFFKYELYDHLDNVQTIFGKKGSKVSVANANTEHFNLILEIAKYVEKLAKSFFKSYYKINRLEISKADLQYNDYSLSEKFSAAADPLFIESDSIDKNKNRVNFALRSDIKPYGHLLVKLSINPKDSSDLDLNYHLNKIPLTVLNPYLVKYTSFPMDNGTIDFNGEWHVRNGNIQSQNHLLITDPHIAGRRKNKDSRWLPIRFLMAFIRERSEVIDYEIPVTGNLNDPKFHLWNVILNLFKNIIIKPPTTPPVLSPEKPSREINEALTFKWEMRQCKLSPAQERFVKKISRFLNNNTDASLSVHPVQYEIKEKEHILFYEAKKKYYLMGKNEKQSSFNTEDSMYVVKMSVKDSGFVRCLDKHLKKDLVFTVQEKCMNFVGDSVVNKKFEQLVSLRAKEFRSYFKENNTDNRLKINTSKYEIPFDGFSFYKLNYKGELPNALVRAYRRMKERKGEEEAEKE